MATNNSVNNGPSGNRAAFMMYLGSNDSNVTGNGGLFTLGGSVPLTIFFDNGSNCTTAGVFTAPVTGFYYLQAAMLYSGLLIASGIVISIVTTAKTLTSQTSRSAIALSLGYSFSACTRMTAGDTAYVTSMVTGELGNTADAVGGSNPSCFFSGFYIGA